MPSNTQYKNIPTYEVHSDPIDGNNNTGQMLDDIAGSKSTSMATIVDNELHSHDVSIFDLQSKVSAISENEFKIYEVSLQLSSQMGNATIYTGTTTQFDTYKNGYMYLFNFDTANVGAVQFNINTIGYYSLKKIKNGVVSDLESGDLKVKTKYLTIFSNKTFVLVGENINTVITELKAEFEKNFVDEYIPKYRLPSVTHNLNKYPNCNLFSVAWGAGIGGCGEGPCGGGISENVPMKYNAQDTNIIDVYSIKKYIDFSTVIAVSANIHVFMSQYNNTTSLVMAIY